MLVNGMDAFLGNKGFHVPMVIHAKDGNSIRAVLLIGLKGYGKNLYTSQKCGLAFLNPMAAIVADMSPISLNKERGVAFYSLTFPIPEYPELRGRILLFQWVVPGEGKRLSCSDIQGVLVRKREWLGPGNPVWNIKRRKSFPAQFERERDDGAVKTVALKMLIPFLKGVWGKDLVFGKRLEDLIEKMKKNVN